MNKKILAIGLPLLLIGSILSGLPFVNLSKIKCQSFETEMASPYFQVQDFEVSSEHFVYHTINFEKGQFVNINFSALSYGTTILFVVSANSTDYFRYQGLNGTDENFTAPITANYTFSYQIPYFSTETVHCDILVTSFWNMTTSADVVEKYPILPLNFLYLGVGFAAAGIFISVYGVRKIKSQQ